MYFRTAVKLPKMLPDLISHSKGPFTCERVLLDGRVTLGSRVSLLLCITQFVLHEKDGAPRG